MNERSRMDGLPLVSVAITCYNYEQYVGQAIESALTQDYPNLEVVVLDNASTDGSLEVIERYASDPRVRIVRNASNLGIIGNHNKAITECAGEFLVFLSADDIFFPGSLRRAIHFYEDHPNVEVLYTAFCWMDERGTIYERFENAAWCGVDYYDRRNELADLLCLDNYMCFPSMLLRRSFFEECGGFDPIFTVAFDWEFCMRLIVAGKRFAFLNVPSVALRRHAGNLSQDAYISSGKQMREQVMMLDRYLTLDRAATFRYREAATLKILKHKVVAAQKYSEVYNEVALELQAPLGSINARLGAIAGDRTAAPCSPRVSVILPCVGNLYFLGDAIASVIAQDYTDWELMIVLDGRADIGPFVRRFGHENRIRYVRKTVQGGPGAARNVGIQLSRGELIAYLDEDNIFHPGYLSALVGAIDRSGLDVAFGAALLCVERVILAAGVRREILFSDDSCYAVAGQSAWPLAGPNAIPINAVVHHRHCTLAAGPFAESFRVLEDWDFLLRLGANFQAMYEPAARLEIRHRLGMEGQLLRHEWPNFGRVLGGLYNAYGSDASPAVVALRATYVDNVAKANALFQTPATLEATRAIARLLAGTGV